MKNIIGEHKLSNGRIYVITDTGKPYEAGEYPSGGFLIRYKNEYGELRFIDHSPDEECVRSFLRHAERLCPMEEKLEQVKKFNNLMQEARTKISYED